MPEETITGYRQLTPLEVDMINKLKSKGEEVGVLMAELSVTPGVDQRWLNIATTHFQQGMMAATRSVAKPTTFS